MQMLKYLTIFDPSKTGELDSEAQSSLLLFHEFGDQYNCSLNEKLSRIGIIQGIWSMSHDIIDEENESDTENIIELDNEIILTIFVESRFFIVLVLSNIDTEVTTVSSNNKNENNNLHNNISYNNIPYQFYVSHLWLSYRFFILQYGTFQSFYDKDTLNTNQLTNLLNEHMIPFWNDIYLKPSTLIRRGLDTLWYESFKCSEFNINNPLKQTNVHNVNKNGDNINSVDTTSNSCKNWHLNDSVQSWDSMILRDVILNEESFPGIIDILIYNLPNVKQSKFKGSILKKQYGFIRNFTNDLENLADLSNWLYHLHTSYGTISNHVITGNMHYKERAVDTEDNSLYNYTNEQNNNTSNNESVNDENTNSTNGTNSSENPNLKNIINSLSSYSNRFLHNVTLPISFAYDAVHEVGVTTGISNSVSLFKDYIPRWSTDDSNNNNKDNHSINYLERGNIPRHGFLISPLANKNLPISYRVKKLNLKFRNQDYTRFNTLFWFYNDILVLIVCKENFDRIWDTSFLIEMDQLLTKGIVQFHEEVLKNIKINDIDQLDRDFAYMMIEKTDLNQTLKSSIPAFLDDVLFDLLDSRNRDNLSPLDLVFTGIDNHSLSFKSMGKIFGLNSSLKENQNYRNYPCGSFLNSLSNDELWDLQNKIVELLETFKNSKKQLNSNIDEERLLMLNDGLICYIRKDTQRSILIIKKWIGMKKDKHEPGSNRKTLLGSLGKDVLNWWEQFQ